MRPFHGIRARVDDLVDLPGRCRAVVARLPPESFLSHSTAALLWGMPLPLSVELDPTLHVAVLDPLRPPQFAGIASHQIALMGGGIRTSHGLRLTSPVHTWCLIAETLSVADIVAAGDFLVTGKRPLATLAQLAAGVEASAGRRGARALASALPLVRVGPRSRPETHGRLLYTSAGLPEPELNGDIYALDGTFVAMSDFVWREERVANEYEGEHHRDRRQFRIDILRRERVEDAGWRLSRFTGDDIRLRPEETVLRMGNRLGIRLTARQVSAAVRLAGTIGR